MVPVTDAPPPPPPPPPVDVGHLSFFLNLALLVLHKLSAVREMPEVYALGKFTYDDTLGKFTYDDALGKFTYDDTLGKFTYDDTLVSYPGGSSPMMIHWCHIQGEVHL